MHYSKEHLSSAELVKDLEGKGLVFNDRRFAEGFIESVGYSRLRIYLQSRRNVRENGKPFAQGTTFEEIASVYELDDELRSIVFKGCSKIEVLFRNTVSEALTEKFGAHPYKMGIFRDENCAQEAMKSLSEVFFNRLSQDQRAKHYFSKYDHPTIPPLWTMKEFFTFEKSVRFYGCLNDMLKVDISKRLGFEISTHDVLTSWIKPINDLRNICAHHDRLFNRKFQKQPQNYRAVNLLSDIEGNRLAALLRCVDFLGRVYHDEIATYSEVQSRIREHPYVRLEEAGFPTKT